MYWPTFKIIKIKAKWAVTSNSDRVTGLGLTFLLYTAKQLPKVCEKNIFRQWTASITELL